MPRRDEDDEARPGKGRRRRDGDEAEGAERPRRNPRSGEAGRGDANRERTGRTLGGRGRDDRRDGGYRGRDRARGEGGAQSRRRGAGDARRRDRDERGDERGARGGGRPDRGDREDRRAGGDRRTPGRRPEGGARRDRDGERPREDQPRRGRPPYAARRPSAEAGRDRGRPGERGRAGAAGDRDTRGRPGDSRGRTPGDRDGRGRPGDSRGRTPDDRDGRGRPGDSRGRTPGDRDSRGRPGDSRDRAPRDRDSRGRSSDRRDRAPRDRDSRGRSTDPRDRAPREWGGLARKGTRWLDEPGEGEATKAWREAVRDARRSGADRDQDEWQPDRFVEVDEDEAPAEPDSAPAPQRTRRPLPDEVARELSEQAPPGRAERLRERLEDASRAYERDRYQDAFKLLKPLADEAPAAAAVRELYGLTLYRLGRWREAIRELEAFRELTQSYDQHPTLADCYRALKRWADVDRIWADLKQVSPEPALLTEGRMVAAGSLADRGEIGAAIQLLEQSSKNVKRPKPYHLRLWYTLADLYERAGEVPRARELFRRVAEHDPELYDVRGRLRSL